MTQPSVAWWWIGLAGLTLLQLQLSAKAEATVTPTVWLSVNRQEHLEIGQGWPLPIRAQVLNEELMLQPGMEQTQWIASTTGNWPDSLRLQVIGPTGDPVTWQVQAAREIRGPLRLSGDSGGQVDWWVTPETTATWVPGGYYVQAILNTTNSLDGWRGVAKSPVLEVQIRAGSKPWSNESSAEKALLESEYAAWRGNTLAAVTLLDGLLAEQPTLLPVLSRKADFLAMTGQEKEAAEAYELALDRFLQDSIGTEKEPPNRLVRNRKPLLAKALFATRRHYVPLHMSLTQNRQLTLRWSGAAGKEYRVESSPDLKTWDLKAGPIAGEDRLQLWTATVDGSQQFYRVWESP